ncbi:FimV/HubP family polar landmark protein [Pseudomonas cichorii]|nr:FimV/HubP family polar landmark protein [Pseudomonas cichorii]
MLKSSQAAFESASGTRGKVGSRVHKSVMAASLVLSSLFYSTLASALGLGGITLHSALNQPLDAEIELLETGGLGAEDVIAKLASPEVFAKAGIERAFFLNDLRFTPVIQGNRGVIHVVSSKPVTEPYLSFMVQLARPNGDLLHAYTLLLDPATTPEGQAAIRNRKQERAAQPAAQTRMPVAPPAAQEGKRYTVSEGDTLNALARSLQGPQGKVSASQLAEGIRALNPQAFANGANSSLKVGQVLLLPDAAVVPSAASAPAANTAPNSTQAAEAQQTADQLAAAAIESQQLARTVEDLKVTTQELQEQIAGKDKQIIALRTELAQVQSAATPAVAPAPAPVAAQPAAPVQNDSLLSWPVLLGAALIVLLLLAFAYARRRQQLRNNLEPIVTPEEPLIKPAQSTILPVFEVPAIAEPQPVVVAPAPVPVKAPVTPRLAGSAPDALDGVSIYIAYGRFSEALGILRDALEKQPEREDIRIRMLELLAEQGDAPGFAKEEQAALEYGVDAAKIQEVRARYPQMKVADLAPAAVVPAVAAPVILEKSEAKPAAPEPDAQLDETAAAALNPEQIDEFQLNLDDLSMDANWDLVDPFDNPPNRSKAVEPEAPVAPEVDPAFSSNLTQLPEVFELSDDQFLSDFSEPEVIEPVEVIQPADSDSLSDDFLDSFMDDDSEFDLLDLDEAPLSRINEAQVLIDEGEIEAAREILLQVIEESDEQHQLMARELLDGL